MSPKTLKGNSKNLSFKRRLRTEMTEPEKLLWTELRSKQFLDLKFRRQHGIGPYIVDFYCPQKTLAIEIDGDTHGEMTQKRKDKDKDVYLNMLDVRVIRYKNDEIIKNLEGVLEDLTEKLKA